MGNSSSGNVDCTTQPASRQFIPERQRYRDTVSFLDQEIATLLKSLDPQKNLIIVTGWRSRRIAF
jgi:arylsulfatase A-like enzyme